MARNFPSSPVVDQVFEDYVFDGEAWKSFPTLPGGVPAGTIVQWGGATVPANWLLCDGSAVSRSTYASLFAAVGTAYGVGNGSSTFNLPDLRGRIPVGKNGGSFGTLGATGGVESVTLTAAQSGAPAHSHSFSGSTNTTGAHTHSLSGKVNVSQNGYGQNSPINGNAGNFADGTANSAGDHSHTFSGTTGNSTAVDAASAHTNLQPYQVVNYIIKATAAASLGDSELAVRVGASEAAITTINTTARTVAQGGTGRNTLTAGAYLKGNGTTAIALQTGIPVADVSGQLPVSQGGTGATTGAGLVKVIPISITNSAGSASLDSTTGEVTFTNVTSIGLNGIFTSAFRSYRIIYSVTGAFTQTQMYRFRSGGTDNSAASYYFEEHYANVGSMGASGWNNQTTGRIGYSEAGYRSTHLFDVINPQMSQPTELLCNFGKVVSPTICQVIGGFNATTQFDGMNFYLGAGTGGSSGTLNVYGYR